MTRSIWLSLLASFFAATIASAPAAAQQPKKPNRHLGSAEDRFPMHQGFDEWYGTPRTYGEAMWPSLNETKSMWPSVGNTQGWDARVVHPEHIYEARKGGKARQIAELDVDRRRTMEAEITSRAAEFVRRDASVGKPFYAHVSFSFVHMPTLPILEFAGKTGNDDWADCLAEMDFRRSSASSRPA